MRVFADNSDQMLREGNGWEVIDEEQAIENAKEAEESESHKSILGFKNYNNYMTKSNSRIL